MPILIHRALGPGGAPDGQPENGSPATPEDSQGGGGEQGESTGDEGGAVQAAVSSSVVLAVGAMLTSMLM